MKIKFLLTFAFFSLTAHAQYNMDPVTAWDFKRCFTKISSDSYVCILPLTSKVSSKAKIAIWSNEDSMNCLDVSVTALNSENLKIMSSNNRPIGHLYFPFRSKWANLNLEGYGKLNLSTLEGRGVRINNVFKTARDICK